MTKYRTLTGTNELLIPSISYKLKLVYRYINYLVRLLNKEFDQVITLAASPNQNIIKEINALLPTFNAAFHSIYIMMDVRVNARLWNE